MPPARSARRGEEGFALIIVLSVLVLLVVVAIALQKSVVGDIRTTSNIATRARVEALADGITRLAIRHLVLNTPTNNKSGPFQLDGTPLTCRAGATVVSISFVNNDGLINLNLASQALFERVFTGIGMSATDASRLAQDIIDFRSPGDETLAGGSKRARYEQAGSRRGPKNAPFQSVGELDQVTGMTPALVERLRPLMTVHSRFAINPSVASLPVALALSGETSARSLDALKAGISLPAEFTFAPKTRATANTNSNTYLVRVAIRQGRSARFSRIAVVEMKAGTDAGAAVMDWSDLDPDRYGIDPAVSDDTPACIGGVLSIDPA